MRRNIKLIPGTLGWEGLASSYFGLYVQQLHHMDAVLSLIVMNVFVFLFLVKALIRA